MEVKIMLTMLLAGGLVVFLTGYMFMESTRVLAANMVIIKQGLSYLLMGIFVLATLLLLASAMS
jgi:hypothetical protein